MRDYIAWYLVELRRRLKGVEPRQRVEDFLLETRAHLGDAIEDMTERGIPEDAATKSAIADFGHPALVAQAFQGRMRMSPGLYWSLVAAVVLLALPVLVQVVASSTDNALGGVHSGSFNFGSAVAFILCGIGALAIASRKWCSLPIAVAGLAITASVGFWFMNNTRAYAIEDGTDRFALLSDKTAKEQVSIREEWLKEYETEVPKLSFALQDTSEGADHRLAALVQLHPGYYSYPLGNAYVGYMSYYETPKPVPSISSYSVRSRSPFIALEEARTRVHYMSEGNDRAEALKSWRASGPQYLASLSEQAARLAREKTAFLRPASVAKGEVISRLFYAPLAIIALFSLLGVLINGVAIGAFNLLSAVKRRGWRHQLT